MITSSPGLTIESTALAMLCFAPVETTICSGLKFKLFSLLNFLQIASLKSR